MEAGHAIISGGVVGLSAARGLLRLGLTVTVLDGEDGSHRASRDKFGPARVKSEGTTPPR
jgi:hydrogen cyanide synthase HcnC